MSKFRWIRRLLLAGSGVDCLRGLEATLRVEVRVFVESVRGRCSACRCSISLRDPKVETSVMVTKLPGVWREVIALPIVKGCP